MSWGGGRPPPPLPLWSVRPCPIRTTRLGCHRSKPSCPDFPLVPREGPGAGGPTPQPRCPCRIAGPQPPFTAIHPTPGGGGLGIHPSSQQGARLQPFTSPAPGPLHQIPRAHTGSMPGGGGRGRGGLASPGAGWAILQPLLATETPTPHRAHPFATPPDSEKQNYIPSHGMAGGGLRVPVDYSPVSCLPASLPPWLAPFPAFSGIDLLPPPRCLGISQRSSHGACMKILWGEGSFPGGGMYPPPSPLPPSPPPTPKRKDKKKNNMVYYVFL